MLHRRSELERAIEGLIPNSPWATEVARLRCMRGIDTLNTIRHLQALSRNPKRHFEQLKWGAGQVQRSEPNAQTIADRLRPSVATERPCNWHPVAAGSSRLG